MQTQQPQQERGGVAWCDIYGKTRDEAGGLHLVKISLTHRSDNASEALRGLMEALQMAKEEFHLTPYQPDFGNAPAQARQTAVPALTQPAAVPGQPVVPPTPAVPAAPAPVQAPAGQAAAPSTGGIIVINEIKVTPQPGGKSMVEMMSAGHKWADLKMTQTPELLAQKFGAGWTAAHFQAAAIYNNLNLKVAWVPSTNLKQDGTPYKNFSNIVA
jgi:hypothetical protein